MAYTNRREFLGAVGAGLVLGGYTATAAGYAANETIRVACIGTGGRCRHLMKALKNIPGAKITAVCDVWDTFLEEGKKLAEPGAFATKNYEDILARDDIDAVLIGTPDHWHVPLTIASVKAKKDVYVEKPLTHDLAEGQAVIDAVKKSDRIVQVGMQQRSMPHIQKGYEIIKSGALGEIHKVHLTWNRNGGRGTKGALGIDPKSVDWKNFVGGAREQPYDEYRFRNWRWFWDFGGGILTDLMVHFIDVANWYCDLDHPAKAVTIGDYFQNEGLWETPDTIQTLLQYPDKKVQIYFEGTFFNARNAAMMEFMGSEGTLYVDRGRYEVIPERKKKLEPSEMILGAGPKGADFYDQPDGETLHLSNWLECIRSRKQPNAPVEAGVRAVMGAHLGNKAYRTGETAKWES